MTSVRGDGPERPGTDDPEATARPDDVRVSAVSGSSQPPGAAATPPISSPPPPAEKPAPEGAPAAKEHRTPWWKETLILVVTALVLALIIKTFFVQAFYIPSGSMEPTLKINDRILVEKVSYWFGTPQRGDIVVFKDPDDWLAGEDDQQPSNPITKALAFVGLYPTGGHLVKRVVGIGGDHVACRNDSVVVNGVPLQEQSYVKWAPQGCLGNWSVHVPPNHLWVLGDNRLNSADSRAHMGDPGGGFVPVSDVVGKVFVTVWPPSDWRFFERPADFDNPALNKAAGVIQDTIPLGALLVLSPTLYRRFGSRGSLDDVSASLYEDDEDSDLT